MSKLKSSCALNGTSTAPRSSEDLRSKPTVNRSGSRVFAKGPTHQATGHNQQTFQHKASRQKKPTSHNSRSLTMPVITDPRVQRPSTIPESDPRKTDNLWKILREKKMSGFLRATEASRARHRGGMGSKGLQTATFRQPKTTSQPHDIVDTVTDPATEMVRSTVTVPTRTINPRNPNFTRLILHPRRIFINEINRITPSAFAHFGTAEPDDGATIDYSSLKGLGGASIWIVFNQASLDAIAAEYLAMRLLDLCEEEYVTFAKETFFKRERRAANMSEDRQWRAERVLHLVSPPKEKSNWRIPPTFSDENIVKEIDWKWDLRPDCSYWLSLRGFNPEYDFLIQNCTFLKDEWITCPYFTIEPKREGLSENVAIAQVAAAGSLALYNRYRLHDEALRASRRSWAPEDTTTLRHYAVTYVGPKFVIWVLEPSPIDVNGAWNGCSMTRLCQADCTNMYEVRELVNWINEIHRWGLSKHGPSCERDVKIILQGAGVRTSEIGDISGQSENQGIVVIPSSNPEASSSTAPLGVASSSTAPLSVPGCL